MYLDICIDAMHLTLASQFCDLSLYQGVGLWPGPAGEKYVEGWNSLSIDTQ
jgi:hypothetical protein